MRDGDEVDWAHTPQAAEAREAKAVALAKLLLAGRRTVEQVEGLSAQDRRAFERNALGRPASDETWQRARDLLEAQYAWERLQSDAGSSPDVETRPCVYGCAPARLYPCGWRCDEHAPGVQPTPNPEWTADGLRAAKATARQ